MGNRPSEPATPPDLDRRRFLSLAVGGGAAVAAAALLDACGPAAPSPPGPPRAPSGASIADFERLGGSLTGKIVLPANRAYGTDKQLFNPRFDSIDPAAIAYCASVADVQRVLEFARTHQVQVAARSGGHSYGGYSLCSGIVIDVTMLDSVAVDVAAGTVTVGAGTRLIDLYSALAPQGVLIPGGSCPTVGIAGLTLGGGVGVFSRKFGLTCDHLEGLGLVTADSVEQRVDASTHPDLLWASQGGGGPRRSPSTWSPFPS